MSGAIRVDLTGDWDRLRFTLNSLNTNLRQVAVALNQDQAQRAKEAIENNVFNMGGKPYGSGIWWIETLELMSNLEVKKVGGADSGFFVGFGNELHSHKGAYPISNNAIAELLEASHPLIQPTWEKIKGDFIQEWQDLMIKAVHGGV